MLLSCFCIDHLGLILMPMNLNLKDVLKLVVCTLSACKVCAYMIPVACCYLDYKVLSCCFGQIVLETCIECMCWIIAPFWACSTWNLLSFACSFMLTCCIHVLECLWWCFSCICINAMFNLFCSYLLSRNSELNELYM